MAVECVKTKILFSDNKEFNSIGFVGKVSGSFKFVPDMDETIGSSIFPLIVNSLPFHWSAIDIAGLEWSVDITENQDGTTRHVYKYGGFSRVIDPSYSIVNNPLPMAIMPTLTFNIPSGATTPTSVTVAFSEYYFKCYVSNSDYIQGSFRNGATLHSGTFDAGFTINDAIGRYTASTGYTSVGCVDITDSGGVRYVAKSRWASGTRYDYFGGRWDAIIVENGAITSALRYGSLNPDDLSSATVTLTPNMYYYDGQFKTPAVTVTLNGVQLTENVDYIKTYENNRDPGLASVLVAGIGNYEGSVRQYFSIYSSTNPYDNLEPSGPSNTTPTYDYSSDTVGKPAVPTLSMSDIGFVRIYNPSKTQLQSLAQYLWTDTTFLDTIINHAKQLLENPIDGIICLNLLPCDIPNGGTEEFKLLFVPTGVQLTVAANQFVEVNCGKVTIETVYGSALDYAPYTKASMFLPYVGQVSLNIDEIMGKTLRVYYHIDIVSGGCVAIVEVDGTVMYQFSGHCAISMPLTGADYSNLASAMISTVKAAATMGANAGAGIAQAAMEMMSTKNKKDDIVHTVHGDNMVAVGEGIEFTSLAARNIANTVGAVMGSKPEISRTGTFSGNTGYLGVRRPYVILERPRLCNPSEYGKFNGYPSMQTVTLSNISGFTQVQQVQLTGISATASELNEIEKLLKSGVIL